MRTLKTYFLFVLSLLLVPGLALAATSVGNNVSVGGALDVTGATTLDGAVTLGDATGDDITVTGYVASNVLPKTNNTYDLGAFAKAYNDVFASGTVYADTFYGGTLTVTSTVALNGAVTLGDAYADNITVTGRIASALWASSTLYIGATNDEDLVVTNDAVTVGTATNSSTLAVFGNTTLTGGLFPQTNHNNLYDLGTYASAWRNVYASGTAFLGDIDINGVAYAWPSSQGAASTYLKNNGSGSLTWETVVAGGTNDWGRFASTYGNLSLLTSSTYPVWFDNRVYASSSFKITGENAYLDIGGDKNGEVLVYIKATSSIATPLYIEDSNGGSLATFSSSSFAALWNGSQNTYNSAAQLELGDNSGLAGVLTLKGTTAFSSGPTVALLSSGGAVQAQLFSNNTNGYLILGSGSATSTLTHNSFTLGEVSGSNQGKFYVDSNGVVSASSSLTVFGNATLGNSDAAGTADLHRAYGSLAMGAAPTGNAQLYLKATSTAAVPLAIYDESDGLLMKIASSSAQYWISPVYNGAGVYTYYDSAVLTLGNSSKSGFLLIDGTAGQLDAPELVVRDNGKIIAELGSVAAGEGGLVLSDSTATTTLDSVSFWLGITSGYNQGKFYVDPSGNVSASGTVQFLNTVTSTLKVDSSSGNKGACLKFQDVDGGGYTYCYYLNGVETCSQTSCE